MPTVPTSFVPQVSDIGAGQIVPFEATPGQPMQNLAPEQQVKMGAAMTDAGNVMFRIGSTIQDKINEAAAKEADTKAFAGYQQILRGPEGYFNAMGKDADTRLDQTRASLGEVVKNIEDGLANPTQKRMFRQAAARNLAMLDGQMMDHRNREVTKWEINGSAARTESYVGAAIDSYRFRNMRTTDADGNEVATGPFHENVAVALREQHRLGALLGIPVNSDQMKSMERKVVTDITEGVAQRLSSENNFQDALDFVNQQRKAGNLDVKAGEQMIARLTAQRKTQQASELANSIMQFGNLNTPSGSGNYVQPADGACSISRDEDGAWKYQTLAGTPIVAPTDGRVIDVKDDPNRGRIIAVELTDGTVAKFYGVNPRISMDVGDYVQRGSAIAMPEVESDQYGYFGYSLERDGRRIDPSTVNSLTPGSKQMKSAPPADQGEATRIAREGIADPELRDATIANMDRQYAQMHAATAATNARIEAQLAQQMLRGNAPDPRLLSQLPAKRQKEILEERRKETSLDVRLDIAKNGGFVSDEYLVAHASEMTKEDLLRVYEQKNALGREQDVMDAQDITDFFNSHELTAYSNPDGKTQKAEALRMRNEIQKRIRAEQVGRGGKMTPEDKRAAIEKAYIDNAYVGGTGWFTDTSKSMLMMTAAEREKAYVMVGEERINLAEIPPQFKEAATAYGSMRNQNPTAEYIAQMWVNYGKPRR